MKKLDLNFMVDPSFLSKRCRVKDSVKVKILYPDAEAMSQYLGQSGKRMAREGATFYFTNEIALELIDMGLVKLVK
jgi:hypothetical protein